METETTWKEANIPGLMTTIGPLLSSETHGRRLFGLRTDSRHINPQGAIHGGVLSGLLDQVIARETWTLVNRVPVVTVQMDTRFLASAMPGDFLTISAHVKQMTGSLAFVDGQITCKDKTVATASAVLKIIRGGAKRA